MKGRTSKEQCQKDGWKGFQDASGNPLCKLPTLPFRGC
jgi:hypothetical protein